MESFTLGDWLLRRAGGELRAGLEFVENVTPLGVAVRSLRIFGIKFGLKPLSGALPNRPKFQELEGFNPTLGQLLDVFEMTFHTVNASNEGHTPPLWDWLTGALFQQGNSGNVMVWPPFVGRDP